jgi:transcriptional regulator with XRE-family HTH domain
MIKNSRELKHSIEQIQQFRTALDQFDEENCPAEVDPLIHRAYRDGLASQLESLEREVAEFERLQTGDFDWSGLGDPATHPEILIKARIARKLSERQLAERIGATARQIREWEDNDYDGVAASRIGAIARALDINAPRRPFLTIEAPRGSISDLLAIAQQLGAVASATFSPRRFAGALHEPVTGALGADLVLAMLAFGEARTAVSFLTEAARWATENRQSVAIKGLDGRTALSLGAGAEYPEEELARIVAALEQSETPA